MKTGTLAILSIYTMWNSVMKFHRWVQFVEGMFSYKTTLTALDLGIVHSRLNSMSEQISYFSMHVYYQLANKHNTL